MIVLNAEKRAQKSPASSVTMKPGIDLATTYSHRAYRPTTIGATVFHFRVRNGTGWFHHAMVTRGRVLCCVLKSCVLKKRPPVTLAVIAEMIEFVLLGLGKERLK